MPARRTVTSVRAEMNTAAAAPMPFRPAPVLVASVWAENLPPARAVPRVLTMPFLPVTGSESMGRPRPSSATLTEPSACRVMVTVDPPWLGSATSSTALSTSSRKAVLSTSRPRLTAGRRRVC
ncbi:Uncharacterised protein [Mycobacteroides abscessus subsp. abscessus]|nr:Uncharacterised protein [Mycobacteroides abscessus subsp. abscessus]